MRILFVTPYPLSRIRARSYGFVTHLARKHDVKVLALCAGEREMADVRAVQREGIDIVAVYEERLVQFLRALLSLGSGLPLQVAFSASAHLRMILEKLLSSGHFDLLHVEFVRALGMLPMSLPVPVVWDAVDCVSQLYEQGAKFGMTPMLRLFGSGEARRVRTYELAQLLHFRHILITAERDRRALLNLTHKQPDELDGRTLAEIHVLPHGIDRRYFHRYSGPRLPETLIFSGKMSFHANIAGAHDLIKRIMPRVWERRPDIRLIIAGSDPPASLRLSGSDPRITFTGYVPDLRPYIARASIAVSPLPYAVGIQNKVLEALALGTPVIASSQAAAGIQAIAGHDLLVADEPETFANAILHLLDDRALWSKLAENGAAYVAANHNWDDVIQKLTAIYTQALETWDTAPAADTTNVAIDACDEVEVTALENI
ncbi:MAG TPA: glycosyltransferase [Ktedonobacteraceae bacterium]|nr:glycosyltransferase [Ktedonobacteraceae bacterium]